MSNANQMQTISEVLEKLKTRGIDKEFSIKSEGLTIDEKQFYQPADLLIVKVFRFEGVSDPSDMAVIYVIRTNDGHMGYSINAYGTYNDQDIDYDNFMRQVPEQDHNEQLLFEL
jgi:hypothetical protein